ncbi:MAG: reverse transcriptase domain-containing protein [Alistipes indistinctus]
MQSRNAIFFLCKEDKSPQWILEGDIKGCFDHISHDWLLNNIPMDKEMLRKWLKSGYVFNGSLFPTEEGTPQGGIISPTLANMTLDGLQSLVSKAVKPYDIYPKWQTQKDWYPKSILSDTLMISS